MGQTLQLTLENEHLRGIAVGWDVGEAVGTDVVRKKWVPGPQ